MNTTTDTLEMGQAATTQSVDRSLAGLKDGVAQATATMQNAEQAMRQGADKLMKSATDMFSFAQGNFEAFTRSSQILASGMQDMTQSFTATTKQSMDEAMQAMKAMGTAKSLKEAMDLQTGLLRSTMEKAVSHSSKLTDSTVKLSEQVMAPITARLNLAAETFTRLG